MRKHLLSLLCVMALSITLKAIPDTSRVALVIVDIQEFYFPGGLSELVNPEPAAQNAAKLLSYFRENNMLVVHIGHKASSGMDFHKLVKPAEGEAVFIKTNVNAFKGTGLLEYLRGQQVSNLVICGMQTHMCVEAAVRAGADYGFKVTLIHDACATKDLKWENEIIQAKMVHLSTLSTLKSYAKIMSTEEFLKAN
ncbi:cysteine hydrolase family protein [Tenuifilum thalassicum]|uniref:Cysteine hydrolase n=1 Tax=Tenuifilum thalassicum TaxID=2590900 RepID=A0A7D4CQ97_9BACT|nr:cysteine hydrolase family protein [Tenuifilum thalassicum]QKG79265.1 cysteine hydrolase [Tenuifilum thalassicum]